MTPVGMPCLTYWDFCTQDPYLDIAVNNSGPCPSLHSSFDTMNGTTKESRIFLNTVNGLLTSQHLLIGMYKKQTKTSKPSDVICGLYSLLRGLSGLLDLSFRMNIGLQSSISSVRGPLGFWVSYIFFFKFFSVLLELSTH